MPAIVPSGWPKKEASWSRARETGHNQKSGGWGSETTTPSEDAKGGEPGIKGAGCMIAQATQGTTRGSSTSTTNGCFNPALSAGYGCSNGMDRAANCRDRQKPIDVKPRQSPKNEKLQSTWMNSYELCGPV